MRKKIIALISIVGILMTGCGVPDRVKEEIKNVERGFLSEKTEVKATEKNAERARQNYISDTESFVVSEKRKEQIKKLYQLIYSEEISELYTDLTADAYRIYDSEIFSEDFSQKEFKKMIQVYINGEKEWTDYAFEGFQFSISIQEEESWQKLAKLLEQNGYTGLVGVQAPKNDQRDIVSQGVVFELRGPTVYMESDYMFESEIEMEASGIQLTINVSKYSLCYPEKFSFLETIIEDGFFMNGLDMGGYLERVSLTGSCNEPKNQLQKSIDIYMKEGKPIQIEITAAGEVTNTAETLFSEREKTTVANLLAQVTGDKAAADAFVEIGVRPDKKGSVGKWNWYRIDHLSMGVHKNFEIRLVEEKA